MGSPPDEALDMLYLAVEAETTFAPATAEVEAGTETPNESVLSLVFKSDISASLPSVGNNGGGIDFLLLAGDFTLFSPVTAMPPLPAPVIGTGTGTAVAVVAVIPDIEDEEDQVVE